MKDHLTLCGIQVVLTESGDEHVISSLHHTPVDHTLYVIPKTLVEKFQIDKNRFSQVISGLTKGNTSHPESFTFIVHDKNNTTSFEEFLGSLPVTFLKGSIFSQFQEV